MTDLTDGTSTPASSIRPARIDETTASSPVPPPEDESPSATTGSAPGLQADVCGVPGRPRYPQAVDTHHEGLSARLRHDRRAHRRQRWGC